MAYDIRWQYLRQRFRDTSSLHPLKVSTQIRLSGRCKHFVSVPAAHEVQVFSLLLRTSCQIYCLMDASDLQIMLCMFIVLWWQWWVQSSFGMMHNLLAWQCPVLMPCMKQWLATCSQSLCSLTYRASAESEDHSQLAVWIAAGRT